MSTKRVAITSRVKLPHGAKASKGTQIYLAWQTSVRKHAPQQQDAIELFFLLCNPGKTAEVSIETDTVLNWSDDLPQLESNRKRWEKVRQRVLDGNMPNDAYVSAALETLMKRWGFGMEISSDQQKATFEIDRKRGGANTVIGKVPTLNLDAFFDFDWHVVEAGIERCPKESVTS